MPTNPRSTVEKLKTTRNAWESLRATKSFSGMTLEQFKAVIQPSLDARSAIESLEAQLIAAQNHRDMADKTSLAAAADVVNAVKGDRTEGEDGELYEAMGYVRKSERKSGLRRGKKTPPPTE